MTKEEQIKKLENMVAEVAQARKELEKSEVFKAYALACKEAETAEKNLKQKLKEEMLKRNINKIISPLGKEDWYVRLDKVSPKVKVEDYDKISEQFLTKFEDDEIIMKDNNLYQKISEDDVIIRDKNIYRKEANVDMVKSLIEVKQPLPEGFSLAEQTPRLHFEIGGKNI